MNEQRIPIDRLHAHPMNSNVMTDDLREKLRVHIATTGRYPAVIVRKHPDLAGAFQILDGHNRTSILRELGHAEAVCDVWEVTDREALVLMATLNRLEGSDEPSLRAHLIHELEAHMARREIAGLLPESEREIEDLNYMLEFPAEEIVARARVEIARAKAEAPVVLHFIVKQEQAAEIDKAIEMAGEENGERGRNLRGQGLYNISVKYLQTLIEESVP